MDRVISYELKLGKYLTFITTAVYSYKNTEKILGSL